MIEVETDCHQTARRTVAEHLGPDHRGAVLTLAHPKPAAPEFSEPGAGI